ncbi:MAG: GNAT family N-acetyltransferase [Woeseiaceae bacterium]|nr:GNAT family N-acetyltransferase [Gammaproteobacteria bacterium]NNK25770.1 GNAT family N-acetyltransferase [Woeseiaceae bacterium]
MSYEDTAEKAPAISVREAAPADAPIIAAFNAAIATETENKTLDPGVVQPGVIALLEDTAKGRYWVAESAGEVVGQLMVTYEWSDWRNGTIWWIQSVYVHPDWRRRGIFSELYRHVESNASADPAVVGLRLYVEKHNTRAQQTYQALGMVTPGYVVMESITATPGIDREN